MKLSTNVLVMLLCKLEFPGEGDAERDCPRGRHLCLSPPPRRRTPPRLPFYVRRARRWENGGVQPEQRLLSRGPLTYGATRLAGTPGPTAAVRKLTVAQIGSGIMDFKSFSIRHPPFRWKSSQAARVTPFYRETTGWSTKIERKMR